MPSTERDESFRATERPFRRSSQARLAPSKVRNLWHALAPLVALGLAIAFVYAMRDRAESKRASAQSVPVVSTPAPSAQPRPQKAGEPLDPYSVAGHVVGARIAAVTGSESGVQTHSQAIAEDMARSARIPDPRRPINREEARAAVLPIAGVRSAVWIDRSNLLVMVDGAQHRSMEAIDAICLALEPLGDTLAVIVNMQDVTAKNLDDSATLSRNCQLPEGERAWMQPKRDIDVVPREVREQFEAMQPAPAP